MDDPGLRAVDIAATLVAALILFRHRGNIMRLMSRTERGVGNMTQRIGVLGSGSWGTALAVHLAHTGHEVRLWARDAALASAMAVLA